MNDLIVKVQENNDITINSLQIAELFERRHDNVLISIRSLIQRGILGLLDTKESSYMNLQNKEQPMFILNERASLIVMTFIGGEKAEQGQVKLVDAFLNMRKILAEELEEKITQKQRSIARENERSYAVQSDKEISLLKRELRESTQPRIETIRKSWYFCDGHYVLKPKPNKGEKVITFGVFGFLTEYENAKILANKIIKVTNNIYYARERFCMIAFNRTFIPKMNQVFYDKENYHYYCKFITQIPRYGLKKYLSNLDSLYYL